MVILYLRKHRAATYPVLNNKEREYQLSVNYWREGFEDWLIKTTIKGFIIVAIG
jgi:hypothetical protein